MSRMDHVALIHRRFVELILVGAKTVEARLHRVRCDPFERVSPGDRVYFKQTGGPFRASARVRRVVCRSGLDPVGVRALRREFGAGVGAPRQFWAAKRSARYATLIWLDDVEPVDRGPDYARLRAAAPRRAWFVLNGGSTRPMEPSFTPTAARASRTARPLRGAGTPLPRHSR